MAKAEDMYNGLLIVDKPGRTREEHETSFTEHDFPTSHDVVQRVRRWSKQRRIGHTGTLDPLASGILVLCLGPSTRLVEYYQGHPKTYYAEIVLGKATDTYDAFGEVTKVAAIPPLSIEQIDQTLAQFRGIIQQKPPIFSALKQAGESLHRKARRGETIEVPLRTVTFHSLELIDFQPPDRIILRTACSAGTYIRSLAYDLGEALGSAAHLDILRREAAGPFSLDDALTMDAIEHAAANDTLPQFLRPPGDRLDLPEIQLTHELVTRFGYGQKVVLELPDSWMQNSSFLAALDAQTEREKSDAELGNQQGDSTSEPAMNKPIIAKGIDESDTFVGILRCIGYAKPNNRAENDTASEETLPPDTVWKADKWFAG